MKVDVLSRCDCQGWKQNPDSWNLQLELKPNYVISYHYHQETLEIEIQWGKQEILSENNN